jgi:hypothetical protein
MISNRRGFVRLLGVGTVSAPLAAKEALDGEILKLTSAGSNASSLASSMQPFSDGNPSAEMPPPGTVEGSTGAPWVHPNIRMADYIRVFGRVPEHIERDIRERAKSVYCLDPDIANKRAWSVSVKILTQQQRNYDREFELYKRRGWYESMQQNFYKLFGFRWSW